MLDLPTIKTDFLFEKSQDFNQTTHARPQHPIVFIHNISLYFNCISSVKYLFKRSCHGNIMPFSAVRPKHLPPQKIQKAGKVLMRSYEFEIFYLFQFSKWRVSKMGMKQTPKGLFRKYFICSISLNQL